MSTSTPDPLKTLAWLDPDEREAATRDEGEWLPERYCVALVGRGDAEQAIGNLEYSLDRAQAKIVRAADALRRIIDWNRDTAYHQYGDAHKAESWACVREAREALGALETA